jgi:hypothetical protein
MMMLESAATPIVRIRPAIPGRVIVIGISLISANRKTPYRPSPRTATTPRKR